MARGAPDYSNVKSEQAIYTLLDLGELAARTGSIDVFERSGNLVWMDDFEAATLNWKSAHDGTGSAVALSTVSRLRGAQSCLLTTGSDGTVSAQIYRYLPIPNISSYSLELAFAAQSNITSLIWYIDHVIGNKEYQYQLIYNRTTKTLTCLSTAGAGVLVASGINIFASVDHFHVGKLTVDLATGKYKRFRLDQTTYDMSGIPCDSSAIVWQDYFEIFFRAEGTALANALCYVDNVLVKQNEP